MTATRRGTTLIELVVTIAILGIIASVATLGFRPLSAPMARPTDRILAARRHALAERRPVTVDVVIDQDVFPVTAFPDGSVIADSSLHISRLTGAAIHAR